MLSNKQFYNIHSLNSANTNITDAANTGLTGGTGVASAVVERYMVGTLLTLADKDAIFYKLGNKVKIPQGESKIISFQRFERFALPNVALTEGVTPTASGTLQVSRVSATAEQWGAFVTLSDVMEITVRYKPFQQAVKLMGMQAAETLDREIQKVLLAGTNVYFPNNKTRATLTSSDVIDTPTLRKIRAMLKHNKAPGVSGSDSRKKYIGVCDSFSAADMMADTTFIESAKFQNLEPLTSGEFGEWQGVRWQESNHIPIYKRHTLFDSITTDFTIDNATVAGTSDLADGVWKLAITGYDSQGFETYFQNVDYGTGVYTATTSTDIIKVVLPAPSTATDSGVETPTSSHTFDTGPQRYNIYMTAVNGSTYFLQAANLAAGTYYLVSAYTGSDPNVIVANVTGAVVPTQPPADVPVHNMFIFGNEWYSVAEISGIQTMMTPPGAQHGNELAQRRSVGWKFFLKALITNQLFGVRIETASNNE